MPWQVYRIQVGEGVINQLECLHSDQPAEDSEKIPLLEGVAQVLVGQI